MAGEMPGGDLAGRTIGGRYRVTSVLGRGGMGVVARAVDEVLHREVAVKVLRVYTDASGPQLNDLRARMQREAQAAARIRHSGVVSVYDVTEENGLPVIVMELVDGPSLDEVLARRGSLDPREAAAIGARLMEALDAAHRVGVLHRDVKPGNVLLEHGGRVVLTDFGIASVDAFGDGAGPEALGRLTRTGELVGSLDYMPPERAQGREPGPASDIWSLGMTLYAAVEGAAPFRRTSVWSTLSAIVGEPLPAPRRAGPLAPVLQALMVKEPEQRPSAQQARGMLEQVAAGGYGPPAATFPVVAPSTRPTPAQFQAHGAIATPAADPIPTPVQSPAATPAPSFAVPPQSPPSRRNTLPLPDAAWSGSEARARRRSRALVTAAVAAVLVAGGSAYALVGGTSDQSAGSVQHQGDGIAGTIPPDGSSLGAGSGSRKIASGAASLQPGGPTSATAAPKDPARSDSTGGGPGTTRPPATGPSASPTATKVSTGCTGWTHEDPNPGTYGYMTGSYHIEAGPYEVCPEIALVPSGTKVWYHCYVLNAYGHRWIYVRIAGSDRAGWMSADNLKGQTGPSTRCK